MVLIRPSLGACVVSLAALSACSTSGPTPGEWNVPDQGQSVPPRPAEVMNVELRENVTIVDEVLANCVTVEPDQLSFPLNDETRAAMSWPMGAPVVGDRRTNADEPGNNVFGFMRVVTGSRIEGDRIIVDTQPAGLFDVFSGEALIYGEPASGELVELGDVDPNDFFTGDNLISGLELTPDASAGGSIELGPNDVAAANHALSLGADVDISRRFVLSGSLTAFEIDRTIVLYPGMANETTVQLAGDVSVRGDLDFTPQATLAFGVETSWALPPANLFFEVGLWGDLELGVRTDFDIDFRVVSGVDDLESLTDVPLTTGSALSITIKEGAPIQGPYIGPVPTTFRTELVLDCWYELRGGIEGYAETRVERDFGISGSWTSDDGFSVRSSASSVDAILNESPPRASGRLTGAADAFVECGLTPKVKWLVGGVAGPFVGVRMSANARGSFSEQCGPQEATSVRADAVATLDVSGRVDALLGGEIDVSILGRGFNFGVGPWSFAGLDFGPLYSDSWTLPQRGYGQCIGTCEDGMLSAGESDVDCGTPDCGTCRVGMTCVDAEDCISGVCSVDNVCVATTCEDGRQSSDETDVDCGGGCQPCPGTSALCTAHSDCATGICAPNGRCTDNRCFDETQNDSETDVDCGGTCGVCEVGEGCAVDNDCRSFACSTAGVCASGHCADGRQSGDETGSDCGGPTCTTRCGADEGCDDGTDCASGVCHAFRHVCVADLCSNGDLDPGEASTDCGGVCPRGCDSGQACMVGGDCASGICTGGACRRDFCSDGVFGQDETSTDCGGPDCLPCGVQKSCVANTDCLSGLCSGGSAPRCVADECRDFRLNGDETDVDCGGSCSRRCATGQNCSDASDCLSAICSVGNICISDRCLDRVRNGTESDVDCGGDCSLSCAEGETCNVGTDCASGVCNLISRICVADACMDGAQNGDESDIDCGGSCAMTCALDQGCGADADCASGVCNLVRGRCVTDTCFDGVASGDETDVDCGGSCAAGCGLDQSCNVNGDCASNDCRVDNTCSVDPCSDGAQNGDETGQDCGGSCPLDCAVGEGCLGNGDCISGFCNTGTMLCVATHCEDAALSGDESDVDCGGSCSVCASGQDCNIPADCSTGACSVIDGTCVDRCVDGVTNGSETDIDCGGMIGAGGCFVRCTPGQACDTYEDCDGGDCVSGICQAELPETCRDAVTRFGLTTSGPVMIDPHLPGTAGGSVDWGPFEVYCEMDPNTGLAWTLIGYIRTQSEDVARLQYLTTMGSGRSLNTYVEGESHLNVAPNAATLPASHAWRTWSAFIAPSFGNSGIFRFTIHDDSGTPVLDTADNTTGPGFTTAPGYPELRAGAEYGPGQRTDSNSGSFVGWCSGPPLMSSPPDIGFGCIDRNMRIGTNTQNFVTLNVPVCSLPGTCNGSLVFYDQYLDTTGSVGIPSGGGSWATFAVWAQ